MSFRSRLTWVVGTLSVFFGKRLVVGGSCFLKTRVSGERSFGHITLFRNLRKVPVDFIVVRV